MYIMKMFIIVSVVQLVHLLAFSTSIVDFPCPVGPPCTCDFRNIKCESRGLVRVPVFNITNDTYWYLDLSNNGIKFIPSHAFANLKGMHYLKLTDNLIESISDDALVGSENSLTYLLIQNNKLKTLPSVIGKLNTLKTLSIDGNPLQTLESTVLMKLGPSLEYFTFGSSEMMQWPTSIQYLNHLTSLTVRKSSIKTWPSYAFLGLNKVAIFSIENCLIRNIPITLSMMSSLEVLIIDSDFDLPLSGIPNVAFSGMSSLSEIDIINQNYNTLPNIFHDAITLNSVAVSMTPITFIPASLFPDNTPITQIELNDTRLNQIPEALLKMKQLRQINIKYSNIANISYFNFQGFVSLTYLGIFHSPLSDIADDTFKDLNSLQWLLLDYTNITTVPKALLQLKNPQSLRGISLAFNRVVCKCSSFSWLMDWEGTTTVQFMGSCSNIQMDIKTYIAQEVPKCV